MRRMKFGSALAAVAIATAASIPLLAASAGAVTSCGAPGGIFPNSPGAQSGIKFDCTTVAGATGNSDNAVMADATNAQWHHGAARAAAFTPTNATKNITYAAGQITAADIGRPISGGCLKGGAFIETAGATAGTVSTTQPATGCAAVPAGLVEYTRNRVLTDAACTAGGPLTSATALFAASDIGKSVSGGPFGAGAKITAVGSATSATVAPASTTACTAPDTITIGAATYSGTTVIWGTDPTSKQLSNNATAGQGFTCAGTTLTATAGAVTAGGGFSAAYAGLRVIVKGAAVTPVTSKVVSGTATTLTLSVACPAGVTATVGTAAIGLAGATAPKNGSAMASLSAELNLNPTLVATQDDCVKNTFEGFQVIGEWNNPGSYGVTGVLGAPTIVSTGQILFPTAVVSFSAYVRPQPTGDALEAGNHYEFAFPSLPTTLAVCLTAGNPTNPTALAFGINPTVLATTPSTPTGSGNPGDEAVRAIGPQTGAFAGKYQLRHGTTVIATGALPSCTIAAATATPAFTCGDA